MLTMLIRHASWQPLQARVLSFLLAVLATWWLNRQYTFAGFGLQRSSFEAGAYIAIQVGGAVINFLVFGLCLRWLPQLVELPVLPLAAGAIVGFVFNFIVTRLLLYSRPRPNSRN